MGAKVTIDVEARIARVEASLDRLNRRAEKTAQSMNKAFDQTRNIIRAVAGAAAIRGAVRSFQDFAQAADEIGKTAQAIGVGAEALQTLRFAASQSGVEAEKLDQALGKLSVTLEDFKDGTGEGGEALERLGFSAAQFKGLGLDQALLLLADRFAGLEDGQFKAAAAAKIFGERVGRQLIPFLNEGADGIRKLQEQLRSSGGLFSEADIRAATAFNDNLELLGKRLDKLKIQAIGPVLRSLAELTTLLNSAAGAALNLKEVFDFFFAGDVNIGEFVALRQRETEILKQLAENPPERSAIGSLLFGKGKNFLLADLEDVQSKLKSIEKQFKAREEVAGALNPPTTPPRTGGGGGEGDLEKERKARAQLAKALEDLNASRIQTEADAERKLGEVRLDLLERFHSRGLISEEDFASRKLEILQASSAAAIRSAQSEVEARRSALARATQDISSAKKGEERIAARAKEVQALQALEAAQAKVTELERAHGLIAVKSSLDAADAQRAYQDEVARTSAELLELQGRLGEAAKARADLEFRDARQRAVTDGDAAQVKRIDDLRAARQAQASFNQERQRGEEILRDLAIEEERVNNSRRAGAITEIEQLSRIQEARRRAGQQLAGVGATLRDIAGRSGIPELARQAADFEAQIDSLAASSNLLREKFDSIGESSLATFFDDVISGSKSAEEAFKDFTNSIVSEVNKLVSQELSRRLLTSLVGPSGEGGFGGFFEKLLSGSLFGGGGGGAPVFNALSFPGFQHGGSFTVGGAGGIDSQLVAFRATPGERVEVGAGAGGNISVHINVPPGTDQRAAGNIATEVTRTLSRYNRRNG